MTNNNMYYEAVNALLNGKSGHYGWAGNLVVKQWKDGNLAVWDCAWVKDWRTGWVRPRYKMIASVDEAGVVSVCPEAEVGKRRVRRTLEALSLVLAEREAVNNA